MIDDLAADVLRTGDQPAGLAAVGLENVEATFLQVGHEAPDGAVAFAGGERVWYGGFIDPGIAFDLHVTILAVTYLLFPVLGVLAAKTGVTPDAAGQATAKQLYSRLAPGQYWKPLDGGWVKK